MRSLVRFVVAVVIASAVGAPWAQRGKPAYKSPYKPPTIAKPSGYGGTKSGGFGGGAFNRPNGASAFSDRGFSSSTSEKLGKMGLSAAAVAILMEAANARSELPEPFQIDFDRVVIQIANRLDGDANAARELGRKIEEIDRQAEEWKEEIRLAKASSVPSKYLDALLERQETLNRVEGCCVFRAPWRDWRRAPERERAETELVEGLKSEKWVKRRQRFLVVSDAVHVTAAVESPTGIPRVNRVNRTGAMNAKALDRTIKAQQRPGTEWSELYIIAKHSGGEITLGDGSTVSVARLKSLALQHRVRLVIWGCKSGLQNSSGILEDFDALPLIEAVSKGLRSKNVVTRLDFFRSIHDTTGLHIVLDALDYVQDARIINASTTVDSTHLASAGITESRATRTANALSKFELAGPEVKNVSQIAALASGNYGSSTPYKFRGTENKLSSLATQLGIGSGSDFIINCYLSNKKELSLRDSLDCHYYFLEQLTNSPMGTSLPLFQKPRYP